ncbi:MAG TPA: ABC transporter ATP-binding protein [Candidatus Dormibacteraeota bacterium]|nr:ABC transporter ATP-binding protein [Candidatus Dormibacteraeota bacterium]
MTLDAQIQAKVGGFELELEMTVASRELVALLGPNGAGKTSVLRVLAGLTPLDAGRVTLDGVVLEDPAAGVRVAAEQRPIGMVFQDYLLFPHLSVLENVAFGLRSRRTPRAVALELASQWLERVGLGAYAHRKPSSLSGGEAQRVALARALATSPALLLMDEPMAALDASTRVELRRELRHQLEAFDGVRLVVTHDPVEAMAMADRLVILEQGKVLQSGSPAEVAERPRSRYVADLVGVNLFRGRAHDNVIVLDGGGSLTVAEGTDGNVFAVVHPRTVALYRTRPDGTPRNVWEGRASNLDLQGDRVRVRLEGSPAIVAEVTPAAVRELGLDRGDTVWIGVKATEINVYPS